MEIIRYALYGLAIEVIGTGIYDTLSWLYRHRDLPKSFWKFAGKHRFLMGYSTVLYAPLYSLSPYFLDAAKGMAIWERAIFYVVSIYFVEYHANWFFRWAFGEAPSEESYRKSRWNVDGLIDLRLWWAWMLAGFVMEALR